MNIKIDISLQLTSQSQFQFRTPGVLWGYSKNRRADRCMQETGVESTRTSVGWEGGGRKLKRQRT